MRAQSALLIAGGTILLGGAFATLPGADRKPPSAQSAPSAAAAWNDLSSIGFEGAFGTTLGDVVELPAGVKPWPVGFRYATTPKKPMPGGLTCTVLVTKKTHKVAGLLLESKASSEAEFNALKAALTKKLGEPGEGALGPSVPIWKQGNRSIALMSVGGVMSLTWTDTDLAGLLMDEG